MNKIFQYLIPLYLYLLLIFSSAISYSQNYKYNQQATFRIDDIVADENEKAVKLYITATHPSGEYLPMDALGIKVSDSYGFGSQQEMKIRKVSLAGEEVASLTHILFLLDLSGSMSGQKLEKAKQAIYATLQKQKGANNYFSWFHNDVSPSQSLNLHNFNTVVEAVANSEIRRSLDTDLYRAIKLKIDELKNKPGNKVLILLTDGRNDIGRNPNYRNGSVLPVRMEEVLMYLHQNTDSTFRIYPVGLGQDANERFLSELTKASKYKHDYYNHNVSPNDLGTTFRRISGDLKSNYIVYATPPPNGDCTYGTEKHNFIIYHKPKNLTAQRAAVLGTSASRVNLCLGQTDKFLRNLLIGIALMFLLLIALWWGYPLIQLVNFRRKNVVKFNPLKNRKITAYDLYTAEQLTEGDRVVRMGQNYVRYKTWRYMMKTGKGNLTGEFSKFFRIQNDQSNFFKQNGAYKRLNWLWFGALGGFLAWLLYSFLGNIEFEWYRNFLKGIFKGQNITDASVYKQTFVGIAMGTAICMALSIVEELGQSRRFSFGRVLLRTLVGFLIAIPIFFLESAILSNFIPIPFLGPLIGWSIFGTALGWVVTIQSSIEAKKGLLGGFIAGVIAFLFYYLLNFIFVNDISRLIGFIIYGAILGLMIYVIVKRMEDFELLYLAPEHFAGQVKAISKWLKSPSIDCIYIGRDPNCEVYIKWTDKTVQGRHCRLTYENDTVFLEPLGETKINDVLIRQKTPLEHEDIIKLGAKSKSQMQFLAKDKDDKENERQRNIRRQQPKEKVDPRSRITIKKKRTR